MFVLCPHCQFLVAVDPATGLPPLRCPRCDGALFAEDDPPDGQPETEAAPPEPAAETALEVTKAIDVVGVHDEPATAPDAPATESDAPAAASVPPPPARESERPEDTPAPQVRAAPKPAPSFVRTAHAAPGEKADGRRWPRVLVIAGLTVLLVMQILVGDRAQLAADARWRPAMLALCSMLRCDLPAWREPAAIVLLDRSVAPDPARPGVLHVTASFRNDARWPQSWPTLMLTLSDVDGRVAGARAFQPREYLGRGVTENGLASGQTASIRMDIIEPAPRIVAFTFDFR